MQIDTPTTMAPPQDTVTIIGTSEPEPMLVLRNCPAKATDIELQFQSATNHEFWITIEAPNGEKSEMLHFKRSGKLIKFNPTKAGKNLSLIAYLWQ